MMQRSAIKLDIQGMEVEALMTGEQTLLRNKPLICVEAKLKGKVDKTSTTYLKGLGAVMVAELNKDMFFKWPT